MNRQDDRLSQPKESLYDIAYQFSHNWFRDDAGTDILLYDGIECGLLSQLAVYDLIMDALRDEFEKIPGVHSSAWTRNWMLHRLKNSYLDWSFKAFISRLIGFLSPRKATRPAPIDCMFVYDVWNTAVIDSLALVQNRCKGKQNTAALTFDPRISRRIHNFTGEQVILYPCKCERGERGQAIDMHKHMMRKYQEHREHIIRKLVKILPRNYHYAVESLDVLMSRYYKRVASDLFRVRHLLKQARPKTVALTSDSHRFARMIVLLCRQLKIRTLVVQHGATISRHAYVPVYADNIAVWGELSRRWFRSHGIQDDRMIITGHPRSDHLHSISFKQNNVTEMQMNRSSRPVILVATQPVGPILNDRFLSVLFAGLQPLVDSCELVMKLHPGESDLAYFEDACKQSELPIRLLQHDNLYQLLRKSAVVITMQSTVGVEALALKIPLILITVSGMQESLPYHQYDCSISVETGNQLSTAIEECLKGSCSMEKRARGAERFVADYLYKVDGQCADRIARVIVEPCSGTGLK